MRELSYLKTLSIIAQQLLILSKFRINHQPCHGKIDRKAPNFDYCLVFLNCMPLNSNSNLSKSSRCKWEMWTKSIIFKIFSEERCNVRFLAEAFQEFISTTLFVLSLRVRPLLPNVLFLSPGFQWHDECIEGYEYWKCARPVVLS